MSQNSKRAGQGGQNTYTIEYSLPYIHRVQVNLQADNREQAERLAKDMFDEGSLWDDRAASPVMLDEYEDEDSDSPLNFRAVASSDPVDALPPAPTVPDASVAVSQEGERLRQLLKDCKVLLNHFHQPGSVEPEALLETLQAMEQAVRTEGRSRSEIALQPDVPAQPVLLPYFFKAVTWDEISREKMHAECVMAANPQDALQRLVQRLVVADLPYAAHGQVSRDQLLNYMKHGVMLVSVTAAAFDQDEEMLLHHLPDEAINRYLEFSGMQPMEDAEAHRDRPGAA